MFNETEQVFTFTLSQLLPRSELARKSAKTTKIKIGQIASAPDSTTT